LFKRRLETLIVAKKKISKKAAEAAKRAKAEEKDDKEEKLALTKTQQEAGDKRYWKLVEETIKEEDDAFRYILNIYWKRGERVASLMAEPKRYGNHTAENFGRDIRPDKPYSPDEVRKWHRFFKMYPKPKLEEAIKQKIPWRSVQALLAVEDEERRDALQKQIATGELKSEDVRGIVKDENTSKRREARSAGQKVDGRGGMAVATTLRTFLGSCDDFAKQLDEFSDACRLLDKAPPGSESSKAMDRRKECGKAIKELVPKFNRALKAVEEPGK
jgi:hypothetical protein